MRVIRSVAFLVMVTSLIVGRESSAGAFDPLSTFFSAHDCDGDSGGWTECGGGTYTNFGAFCDTPGSFFCDDFEAACAQFCEVSAVDSSFCDSWGLTDCQCVPLVC
jgi:hypothetical protein